MGVPRRRDDRGAVTAETAVALPVLVLLTAVLAWIVALGVVQVRLVDAARETARGLARGDAQGESLARGREIAPAGARFEVAVGEESVSVEVSARIRGPGRLLGVLPGFAAHARAVAAREGVP